MQLSELRNYKSQLMKDLLTNEKIVEYLADDVPVENGSQLAYTQVFPYEYLPETIDHGKTFICFDVDVQRQYNPNRTFHRNILRVWVFTHKSKMRLPEGGVRVDEILYEIANMVNGSRYYGLGQIELGAVDRFAPIQDFQGKSMTFYSTDFSKTHNPRQSVPRNRNIGE